MVKVLTFSNIASIIIITNYYHYHPVNLSRNLFIKKENGKIEKSWIPGHFVSVTQSQPITKIRQNKNEATHKIIEIRKKDLLES